MCQTCWCYLEVQSYCSGIRCARAIEKLRCRSIWDLSRYRAPTCKFSHQPRESGCAPSCWRPSQDLATQVQESWSDAELWTQPYCNIFRELWIQMERAFCKFHTQNSARSNYWIALEFEKPSWFESTVEGTKSERTWRLPSTGKTRATGSSLSVRPSNKIGSMASRDLSLHFVGPAPRVKSRFWLRYQHSCLCLPTGHQNNEKHFSFGSWYSFSLRSLVLSSRLARDRGTHIYLASICWPS